MITHSIDIDRRAEDVFAYLDQLERHGEWQRQIVSTTETAGFGTRHFEIPFDATGKKWVRFAAWDVAGNGALEQPIKLNTTQTSTK